MSSTEKYLEQRGNFIDGLARALLATLQVVESPTQEANRLFQEDYLRNLGGKF